MACNQWFYRGGEGSEGKMHDYYSVYAYSVYARVRDSRSVPNREWGVPIPNVRISAPEVDAVAPTSSGGFHALRDSLIYLRGRFFYLRGSLIYFLCRFSTPEGPMDQPIFAPFGILPPLTWLGRG